MMLVSGLEGHICETCVEQAQRIVQEELHGQVSKTKKASAFKFQQLRPKQIKEHLDK